MNYQKILSLAQNKLGEEYPSILEDIKNCIAGGSTGGEISSMVGKYLKELKNTNPEAYIKLEDEIQIYLHYCEKQGLYIQ